MTYFVSSFDFLLLSLLRSTASNYAQIDTIARGRDHKTIDVMTVTKDILGDRYGEKLKVFYPDYVSLRS